MKRDMELVRKIMFKIEADYSGTPIRTLQIAGYDMITVAEHCRLMNEYGLIDKYNAFGADNIPVLAFSVGNLTWEGYDFLDKVRQDTVWNKTKDVITKQGLPMIFDVVKDVSTAVITSMTEGAIKALLGK